MLKKHLILPFLSIVFIFAATTRNNAQEIDFGDYYGGYSTSVINFLGSQLEFGEIIAGQGLTQIPISSAVILEISGIKYLDISVNVTASDLAYADGGTCTTHCSIPFDVKAAYINRGEGMYMNTGQAILFTGMVNNISARFPIRSRGNAPPGPPPTPLYEGYTPDTDKAYVYIYGDLTVGAARSGLFTSQILVTIDYE